MLKNTQQQKSFLCFLLELALIFCFYHSYFFPLDTSGIIDYDFFLTWQLAVNDALQQGSLLHWMPYLGGSVPGLANPQSGALSPFNILGFFANPAWQFKIEIFIHCLLCALGFRMFCRDVNISPFFGLIGFSIWIGNGFIGFRIVHGQTTFYTLFLIPILFALIHREYLLATESHFPSKRNIFWGTLVLILILLEDGFLVLIYLSPAIATISILLSWHKKTFAPLLLVILWGFLALFFCLPRLYPCWQLMKTFPRKVVSIDFLTWQIAWDSLFNMQQKWLYLKFKPVYPHSVWPSYGAYLGFVPVFLSIYAFARCKKVYKLPWGITFIMGMIFMFGHFSIIAPWNFFSKLPILNMVSTPSRFVLVLILCFAFFAVLGLYQLYSDIEKKYHKKYAIFVTLMLSIVTVYCYQAVMDPIYKSAMRKYYPYVKSIAKTKPFSQIKRDDIHNNYITIARNIGIINGYNALNIPTRVYSGRDLATIVLGKGVVKANIIPNRIKIKVDVVTPALVSINANYFPQWRVEKGLEVSLSNAKGLIQLEIPKGKQEIVLFYKPIYFYRSIYILALFLLIGLLFFAQRKRLENLSKSRI